MKKVLAFLIALGLLISSASGAVLSADSKGSPSDYDDIPWEYLPR